MVLDWDRRIKHERGCELALIEVQIADMFLLAPIGIINSEELGLLSVLKAQKESVLAFEASSW